MPLNTLRKDRCKHFFGRAARLAPCFPVYSDREKQIRISCYMRLQQNKEFD